MEGLFFAIGFLLGGVVGVLIMCLLQINRILIHSLYRKSRWPPAASTS